MCKTTSMMSESAKNTLGQKAFGHKGGKVPVERSPAASAADVLSQALGAGGVATSVAEKVVVVDAHQIGGPQDDLCMSAPPPSQDRQTTEAGGPRLEEEDNRCLYVGTPWEDDVISNHRDVDEFKAAQRTIARTLSVRTRHCFYCFLSSTLVVSRS
jgi:hypothetical protein